MKYQVTLYNPTKKYRPISTIIEYPPITTIEQKKLALNCGLAKIMKQKYWTKNDIVKYEYSKMKIRKYE